AKLVTGVQTCALPIWMVVPTTAVWIETQPRPCAIAIACGLPPTSIVLITAFRPGSIRDTVPSRLLATQTLPSPTAMPVGERPTRSEERRVGKERGARW